MPTSGQKRPADCKAEELNTGSTKKGRGDIGCITKSDTVRVVIGENKEVFNIHKDLLIAKSQYFEARFKHEWNSDGNMQCDLPDIDAACFKVIVHWLYTGEIPLDIDDFKPGADFRWRHWMILYHCADILLLSDFQNKMIDMDLDFKDSEGSRMFWNLKWGAFWHVYQIATTPYYKLFLHESIGRMHTSTLPDQEFEEIAHQMLKYPQLVIDVMINMRSYQHKKWQSVTKGDRCRYHIHPDGERCRA